MPPSTMTRPVAAGRLAALTRATRIQMTSEQEEEEEQLAAQRVDVFVRSDDDAEWQSVGQGTVMWMPDGDRQRLMVLAEEEPSARPLGSVVLPSERLRHTPDPAPAPPTRPWIPP